MVERIRDGQRPDCFVADPAEVRPVQVAGESDGGFVVDRVGRVRCVVLNNGRGGSQDTGSDGR